MAKKQKGKAAKGKEKKSLFKRIKAFFGSVMQELKRVTWPDRNTLKKNTVTVLAIILSAAIMVFVVDKVVQVALAKAGFYKNKDALPPNADITLPPTTAVVAKDAAGTAAVQQSGPTTAQSGEAAATTVVRIPASTAPGATK